MDADAITMYLEEQNVNSDLICGLKEFRESYGAASKGPIYRCAEFGGFGVLDEINMAKEALVSRLMVIDMPPLDEDTISYLLRKYFLDIKKEAMEQFVGLFLDLQTKAQNG